MDDNDLTWPRREPENWRSASLTRADARNMIDFLLEDGRHAAPFVSLAQQLDEAQAESEDGEAFLLIHIVGR